MIKQIDFILRQGDTADEWKIDFQDLEGKIINISNYKFFMEIRDENNEMVSKSSLGNGLTLQGNYTLRMDKKIETLHPAMYSYAMKIQEPDEDVYTFLKGNLIVQDQKVTI